MRTRDKDQSIARIKQATLDLIKTRGYSETTISLIAEKADRNVALIYRYFPRGILDIILSIGSDFLNKTEEGNIPPLKNTPRESIKQVVWMMLEAHKNEEILLKALEIEYLSHKDLFDEEEFKILTGSVDSLQLFDELIKQYGYSDPSKIREKSQLIFHVIDGLIHRHILIVPIKTDDEILVETITDLVHNHLIT